MCLKKLLDHFCIDAVAKTRDKRAKRTCPTTRVLIAATAIWTTWTITMVQWCLRSGEANLTTRTYFMYESCEISYGADENPGSVRLKNNAWRKAVKVKERMEDHD